MRPDRRRLMLAGGGLAVATALAALLPGLVTQDDYDAPEALHDALARQPAHVLRIDGARIRVVFLNGAPGVDRDAAIDAVERAAAALVTYFGRFPIADYGLLIAARPGGGVGTAATYGVLGAATRVALGTGAGAARDLDAVLAREMMLAALPDLPRRAQWLRTGAAHWLAPVARAQAGAISPADLWRVALDRAGPDRAVAFWLHAEAAVFEATRGVAMLREALVALNVASGGNTAMWQPEQMLEVADAAVGTDAGAAGPLIALYRRFEAQRSTPDTAALLARLGVARGADGAIRFDDGAPLAALRQRIARPRSQAA